MCDGADGQRGAFQQDTGLPQPVIQEIVLDGNAGEGFEQAVKIGTVDVEVVGNILYGDLVAESSIDEFQRILRVI